MLPKPSLSRNHRIRGHRPSILPPALSCAAGACLFSSLHRREPAGAIRRNFASHTQLPVIRTILSGRAFRLSQAKSLVGKWRQVQLPLNVVMGLAIPCCPRCRSKYRQVHHTRSTAYVMPSIDCRPRPIALPRAALLRNDHLLTSQHPLARFFPFSNSSILLISRISPDCFGPVFIPPRQPTYWSVAWCAAIPRLSCPHGDHGDQGL